MVLLGCGAASAVGETTSDGEDPYDSDSFCGTSDLVEEPQVGSTAFVVPLGCSDLPEVPTTVEYERDLEEARQIYVEGSRAYALGRFDEAIDAFCRAYHLVPRAAFLWNIGRALESLQAFEQAATFLEAFAERTDDVRLAKEAHERAAALRRR